MIQLILGGARSGKSRLAEQLAAHSGKRVTYIATTNTQLNDDEMDARIRRHRQQRPAQWKTVEEPTALAASLQELDASGHCLLVDCLTLWLTNCLFENDSAYWQQQRAALLNTLPTLQADVLLIGNELGSGVVPMGRETRQVVDENGFLHQSLAPLCERVILVAAGLPLILKGDPLT